MTMPFLKLKDAMISLSEFKKNLTDLIHGHQTKIIVKNNKPVGVFMGYDEYESMLEGRQTPGEVFTLTNGVKVKVVTGEEDGNLVTKTYIKMKNSNEFKLHFAHSMSNPNLEQTLTTKELVESYELNKK